MKKIILPVFLILVLIVVSLAADGHEYTGTKKCKMCHKGEKHGFIFEDWQKTGHANAYNTLGTPEAAEVYAKLGHSGNPQEDMACLKCHYTGAMEDTSLTAKIVKEEGIGCETCHGAGGDYWKKTTMEDREAAIANGMIAEPLKECVKCHNSESPTFESFNAEERYQKIAHKRPSE